MSLPHKYFRSHSSTAAIRAYIGYANLKVLVANTSQNLSYNTTFEHASNTKNIGEL